LMSVKQDKMLADLNNLFSLFAGDNRSKGMSMAIKILLVSVVLLVVTLMVLMVFDIRLESANRMLGSLADDIFGNMTDMLADTTS